MVPNPARFTYTKYLYCGNTFRKKESNGIRFIQNHKALNTEDSMLSSYYLLILMYDTSIPLEI